MILNHGISRSAEETGSKSAQYGWRRGKSQANGGENKGKRAQAEKGPDGEKTLTESGGSKWFRFG
ncbi:MAG: hypothetical protein AAGU02_03765 [Lawsonibacter sp.]